MFSYGLGVPRDHVLAFGWIEKAAMSGNRRAEYNLGKMYRDGVGTEASLEMAVDWYRRSAEQGYAKAQASLARRYAHGEGVVQDMVAALFWMTIAADQGLPRAQVGRTDLSTDMSAADIAAARQRIIEWKAVADYSRSFVLRG